MATEYDFSRAVNFNIKSAAGHGLFALLSFARDDGATINFTGTLFQFDLYHPQWKTPVNWNTTDDPAKIEVYDSQTIYLIGIPKGPDGENLKRGVYYYRLYYSTYMVAYGTLKLI